MIKRRGVSLGTLLMLCITVLVLIGFAAILPTLTGNQDIRLEAAELVVAIDESFAQWTSSAVNTTVQNTAIPTKAPGKNVSDEKPVLTAAPKYTFSLCATGSIVLNSSVQKALAIDGVQRFDLLTDQIPGAMQADLSIATLENTIISSEKVSNLNMPPELLPALRSTGINTVCLSHPDALNDGITGLHETKLAISDSGLLPYGLYASPQEQASGTVIQAGGVQVALLSYQEKISSTSQKKTTDEERIFAYATPDIERITADISNARASGAQVIIVSLCWGKVGASAPTDEQITLAQQIADAGADIILGTHSGTLQPVRVLNANRGDGKYHPVICAYSLGNLMTHDREKRANLASILLKTNVVYDPSTDTVAFDNMSYTPTYAWRGKEDGKTRYRILLNTGEEPPAFVDKDQRGVMERCYTLVTDIMSDTGIPMM